MPVAILFISIILVAFFYSQLTPEVAYRFNTDGSPKSWLSRGMLALIMLLPQILLVLLAGAVTYAITRIGGSLGQVSQALNLERLILLIGNVVILPQIVFGFIMLDIFSYNVYGSHLMPVWLFVVIVMAIGGVILAIFFIQAFQRSRSNNQ